MICCKNLERMESNAFEYVIWSCPARPPVPLKIQNLSKVLKMMDSTPWMLIQCFYLFIKQIFLDLENY